MSSTVAVADSPRTRGGGPRGLNARLVGRGVAILVGMATLGAVAWWWYGPSRSDKGNETPARKQAPAVAPGPRAARPGPMAPPAVRLDVEQQRAIGLKTARVASGTSFDVL